MLLAVRYRRREREIEDETFRFEQMMLINNPEMYKEYMRVKQDNIDSGNEGVNWTAPDSDEEAKALMDVFAEIDQKINKGEQAADQEFIKQLELMNAFDGINVDEIGDE